MPGGSTLAVAAMLQQETIFRNMYLNAYTKGIKTSLVRSEFGTEFQVGSYWLQSSLLSSVSKARRRAEPRVQDNALP